MASHDVDLSTAVWRKSSHSNGDGGDCVEVAERFPGAARWRKSSNGTGGDCVEVTVGLPDLIPVRDSKNPHGPALVIPATAWTLFVEAVTKGELAG
ncbi:MULTISPECIES: DUF397 domain-containing protein [Streptomyces]|uniref:DUF397 domain-containing protein n=1 Tax=Streptomyces venezuelae TaxID=54571 RepID=A0A5P2BC31_STRVZ|nr:MULTISPECIES: DUF397 domain-containing protein [Streptomyces]NDZ98002.1 DUF397 domain-containing protein [Streptomyces sp. SID10116]MYY86589.1 DUF397 domain-containing protein [Streptomyces sp. SID335]MYZ18267.1 DUF397 domain-containing protein [Streptomyces sp. SID337]NDZ92245.1 DUF397 domain-containing protein [Streptomyces sp. SID10115]NEB44901.1 DUF397 domain-containing protein [Streptomyces sp. SID339]